MNIVVFETEPWEKEAFSVLEKEHAIKTTNEKLSPETVENFKDADIISVFIYSKLNREVLEKMPHLKMIATRSTGKSHIDTEYCEEKGIQIGNVPSYGKNTVAEHAFALIMAVARNIVPAVERTQRGDFDFRGLRGFDLLGKTLGVIGTGDIGEHAMRIARGFGMKIVAFDVKPREELQNEIDFEYADLDTLLQKSDIITIHVPGIPQTKNMIDEEQFTKMKDGVVLINTSRGTVINIQAMVKALAEGKVKGAGLDVLPEEPAVHEEAELLRTIYQNENQQKISDLLANSAVMRMRNVIVTPHSAFFTTEAVERIMNQTLENINSFLSR